MPDETGLFPEPTRELAPEDLCCPQPDGEPEAWKCEHGITWTSWPAYDEDVLGA